MKCKNQLDGNVCGVEISDSAKFCEVCGGKVSSEETSHAPACPKCGAIVKLNQKFCSECGWKVDPSLFSAPKIFCVGRNEDGTQCNAELLAGVKFCPECGHDQTKTIEEVGNQRSDEGQSHPHGNSSSGSSSRSSSPDTWRLPGGMAPSPESEIKEVVDSDDVKDGQIGAEGLSQAEAEDESSKSKPLDNIETESPITISNNDNLTISGDEKDKISTGSSEHTVLQETGTPIASSETARTESKVSVTSSENVTDDEKPISPTDKVTETIDDNGTKAGKSIPSSEPSDQSQVSETFSQNTTETGKPISSPEETGNEGATSEVEHAAPSGDGQIPPHCYEEIPPHEMIAGSMKGQGSEVNEAFQAESTGGDTKPEGSMPDDQISYFSTFMTNPPPTQTRVSQESFVFGNASTRDGQTEEDVRNGNVPPSSVDEKGDAKISEENSNEENINCQDVPLPSETSSSSGEEDENEDENRDEKSSQTKKKEGKKRTKKEKEQKKKDRKKRREERKLESEKTKPLPTPQTGRGEPMDTETKSEKEEKNKAIAGNGQDGSQKNPSYAEAAASGATKEPTKYKYFADVFFHCIVPPNLISAGLDKDKVYIIFEEQSLGGWKGRKYLMKGIRTLTNGYVELCTIVSIPTYLLSRGRINYNYIIVHGSGEKTSETHEYVYSGVPSGSSIFRSLSAKTNDLVNGVYHRFDGVIRSHPSKGTWQLFKDSVKEFFGVDDFKKVLYIDAELSGKTFQPCWQLTKFAADGMNGEELILHILFVVAGLKDVYCRHGGLWFYNDYDKIVGEKHLLPMMTTILKVLHSMTQEYLNRECLILHVVTGLTIAYLVQQFEIVLDDNLKNLLCEAMLPKMDNQQNLDCDLEAVLQFFPKMRKAVCESALKVAKVIAGNTQNPSWMFCLPIIHFLSKQCEPFGQAPTLVDHDARRPEWWGIADFGSNVDYFKGKTTWDRSPLVMLNKLQPYFKMDYLLPRSFLATLRLEDIPDIVSTCYFPADSVLAVTHYYVKMSVSYQKEQREACLNKLFNQVVIQNFAGERIDVPFNDAWRSCRIAGDVVIEVLKWKMNKGLYVSAIEAFLVSLDQYNKVQAEVDWESKEMKQIRVEQNSHWRLFEKVRGDVCKYLSEQDFYKEEHALEYLEGWNSVLKIRLPDGEIRDNFMKFVKDGLELQLHKVGQKQALIKVYLLQNEMFDEAIQAILSDIALKAIHEFSNFDMKIMGEDRAAIRLGDLINSMLERNWDNTILNDQHQILEHILTWASFPTFLAMYYKFSQHLKKESMHLLESSINVLNKVIADLFQGAIVVKDLDKLLLKKDNFQKIIQSLAEIDEAGVMLTLQIRDKELQTYNETRQLVKHFLEYSIHCNANTDELEEKNRVLEHLGTFPLSHLVKTVPYEEIADIENYRPFVTVFELSQDQLDSLPDILECSRGLLFTKLWEAKGSKLEREKGQRITIPEVFEEVWEPTLDQWIDLCNKLKKGDMLFSEFEKYFRTTDLGNLRSELVLIHEISRGDNDRWIGERIDQIEKYRDLKSCQFGAEAILEVVQVYDLKGDFSQIKNICEFTKGADTNMNKLDKSLLGTCSILREVTKERAECLKTFIRCKPLVDWLKQSMKTGLKELKVFVDLASISAGEGDMEIDKVNCLHSATTGYAPLIFNLEKDCDTKKFLEKCQEVWKELLSDRELPRKLLDTNRQLEWLKTVKKSHGSVEVSSLQQAETINSKGIYQLGNIAKSENLRKTDLSEVLELHVTEDDKEGSVAQRKHYRYDQLHDLQSRLMLVAGKAEKGKDEVDRFMLILDSVVRLGKIYSRLIEEGCVLFSQWHVKFLCDRSRKACAFIYFGHGEDKHKLKGRIDGENEDVSAIIPKIATFLENCHEKWLQYIDERREKYYKLNHFTIDQMVILQQELVKIGSNQDPSSLIYPLLSAVKKDCTKEDLVKAMSSAKSDVERFDLERQESTKESDEEIIEPVEVLEEEKTSKFLQEMVHAGYSLSLAKEALKHVGPDDVDEGIVWCMDHEDSHIDKEVDHEPGDGLESSLDQPMFTGWTQSDQSLASITGSLVDNLRFGDQEGEVENLIRALEDLWEKFVTQISSSVKDYLSVEHLGMILDRLAEQETFEVDRTFLPCFVAGEPNLIICRQRDIYNTLLAVYSHEDDRPLPQSDEVLMCTPQTSLDTLEIFWRRAMFAEDDKVYCLVNADLLDYDVSDKGERSLERHMKVADSKGRKYKLVVICSSENEDRSRIVAALDKYRRPQLPTDVLSVRRYLLEKLKVEKSSTGVRPACAVDFERCSVRVVKSWRAGVGKTLYKKRMVADMYKLVHNIQRRKASNVTIPLHEKNINTDDIMEIFLDETLPPRCHEPRIFHIDISHVVQEGVDAFLFQLLVLGCLTQSSGHVWRKSELDYYIIESMPLLARDTDAQGDKLRCLHHCLDILPHITCRSPQESLEILSDLRRPPDYSDHDRLFDAQEFKSATFQRPFQYLRRLDTNNKLDDVNVQVPEGDKKQCLTTLLRHCGIRDPSWSELYHFVSFLNKQLQDFEVSAFCSLAAVEDLPGFAKFVLRFLMQMSRDFSTRSLVMSEESPLQMLKRQLKEADEEEGEENDDNLIQLYQMRRTWETSPHPYLFFNPDQNSMTFLGFNIERRTGNLLDQGQGQQKLLEAGIMKQNLWDALHRNKVNLAENFDALPRAEKITKLCKVMGLEIMHDPDETYELTTDNVKKILAIYMRFRCDIPVIIMGETGCGKTRLIKFMCALQQPPGVDVENMILMKVHGGTKASDIIKKVRKAEEIARQNAEKFQNTDYKNMDTVLFFDEANTTEAIGVIKEIMCDKSLGGKPIKLHEKLKIVAACNPYRKHSPELIKRLEQAGLGYHVSAKDTADKLGHVPMRHLVYRVQSLPQSMLPLVWDFGQLNTTVEEMYIRQMVLRYINSEQLPEIQGLDTTVSKILTVSQDFMRAQQDECSFVSLRDVERVLKVMSWFYSQSQEDNDLFSLMRGDYDDSTTESEEEEEEESMVMEDQHVDDLTRSLLLALGVCYHACLKNREEYRESVAPYFTPPLRLPGGADQIAREIDRCQEVFLENVDLAPNIAKNQALKENVFMMIVCIELRIPMFLVGKPGSSKSLAKTIVADAMQGNAAHKALFKNYKQAQMVSFQCSPLSVPEGIVGTFRQCAAYQKDKNLDRFVSIVVLDEIGLAEDSPRMPLKTLHPLLEDGCPDDEEPEKYKKVAFIGISNWALDPAKMNRGILVQREVPDIKELTDSAEGICSTSKKVLKLIRPMIPLMANSYLDLFIEASDKMREFFGLRDFYSLLKMLYAFVSVSKKKPSWAQLQHCILRNFGGLEDVKPVDIFYGHLSGLVDKNEQKREDDPDCTSSGMIQACLIGDKKIGDKKASSESRYLLLLTENYGALTVLQQKIFTMENVVVIFGSSFPKDQEYTQVCRNINRIKVCMETGSTVILLNLENLYESLYDALNQYYVVFGGERYVDLGLGTHRVKCRVHKNFRLIVVAEKQIVYDKFPIPLINRLEKHFLSLKTMLTPAQLDMADKLQSWAQKFVEVKGPLYQQMRRDNRKDIRKIGDAFMGYHADTCAAIILHVCQEKRCDDAAIQEIHDEILKEAQSILLWCATPAAVLQFDNQNPIFDMYFKQQHHESLADYLQYKIVKQQQQNLHVQITTNSKTLATADLDILCGFIPVQRPNITLLTLQSFDTEQQFSRKIKTFFDQSTTSDKLLIIQCDCGDQNADLIACARYTVQGELQQSSIDRTINIHVVFLIQLPGIAGGCFTGFQCGLWQSVHIDDIHPSPEDVPTVAEMHGQSVSSLLGSTNDGLDNQSETRMEIVDQSEPRMEINQGEADPMDVELELRSPKEKKHFKIDYLIRKCIQPALGNVKDPVSDSSRAIERLKIILNCLQHEEGDFTVMSGIGRHLSSILKEKEKEFINRAIQNWLSTEASRPENINRAGTFRKFAFTCLEARIIPILAGIVAFMDTNKNLDILTTNTPHSWQLNLWVEIFNNPELTQLKYSSIVSPTKQQELQEIAVKVTSKDGKPFTTKMPFSWLIFGLIEDILRETMKSKSIEESHSDVVMKASDILLSYPMGKLLASVEGTHIHDVLKHYIQDFVHMVHPVQSDEECTLMCESVINGCRHLVRGEFGRMIPSILGCHMAYILNDVRYKNFSNIVHVWPDCCRRIMEFQENSSTFYLVTDEEKTLDILALHLLVEDLEPSREALNKQETRVRWLRKVCDYRPVIERIFGHYNQDIENKEFQYGERCSKGIEHARFQWTRTVVVKLFIEHVCTVGRDEIDIRRCMPLWVTLREGANMKEITSLEKVEKFIKSCNKDVVAQCFGQQSRCVGCENPIEGAPVRLPCDHVICRKCLYDCITLKDLECPNCQKEFPADLDPNKSAKVGEIRKYVDYRNRCNSFFMEVVSQLCFAEGTPPSQEVIRKLMSYIIGHVGRKKVERVVSKELTIFDDSIDPTPVVRSFLLQQLMQFSGNEIEGYLNEYFINASELVRNTRDPNNLIELCQLVLQCMEDSLHQQYINRDDEIIMATKMLREATNVITQEIQTLDKIDHISRVRFSLSVVARHIHNLYGAAQKSRIDPVIRRLFDAAAKLCEECPSPWPRRFFVKQLCRCYGIDSYQTVLTKSEASFLRWVKLPELKDNKVKECHDRYIVMGEDYKELRETIVTTVLNEDGEKLQELLENPREEWQTRIKLLLALHREICMNHIYGGDPQKYSDQGKRFLFEIIMNHPLIRNKEIVQRTLSNSLWNLPGNIVPMMTLAEQNLSCLLTHHLVLMVGIPGKTTLVTPLCRIATQPETMMESYYPTMQQDELLEIKEAVLAARSNDGNENPVFYRCPNGHPYIIGNCGNPAYVGVCKECGREIGGQGYQLRPGNQKDQGVDRTETGHILGRAARLGRIVAPERKLDRASFAVLRLLTHMSMYVGANVNIQAVHQTIKTNIQPQEIADYLMEHIDLDLTSIQSILGKNRDDTLVLIHCLLTQIMTSHTMAVIGENQPEQVCGLKDKVSRSNWEEEFAKRYILPVLQEMEKTVAVCNNLILKDQRLGNDPLLQILYETDKPQEKHDIAQLQDVPVVWRYRAMITVNHLRQCLDSTKKKWNILRLFLKEEHHLRAIRYVPSIIRLQKMLIQKYNKKLDRAEASSLTIEEVKKQMRKDRRLREFNHLLEEYIEAWNCVRESLESYACPSNENLVTLEKLYCQSDITDKTPVSWLIPTHRDAGLCSYVLLFFLSKKQNMFLQNYCHETKNREESLPKVHVREISTAHLISYHPDRDLLPMVLANCNYSFEVGQGTRVEYNLTNLERQLMDRFLFSKSMINGIHEMDTITYRSESTNALVFRNLYDRVKQERIKSAVLGQICGELRMRSYPELCEGLDKLDIAISFLKSVGADPESSLYEFMTNTLKLENPFPSPKAQQSTRCKHTMSLWITLALERAKCLAKYDKKSFEGISNSFKKSLTEEQTEILTEILNRLPLEQVDMLVELLFECIVLKIDVPQNRDDEDYVDLSKISLRDVLIGYMDASPYDEDIVTDETLMAAIGQFPSDKKDNNRILTAVAVDVWSVVYKIFNSKQRQRH